MANISTPGWLTATTLAFLLVTRVSPACAQDAVASPATAQAVSASFDPWVDEDYRYRIGAGDEIALHFLVNPELDAPVIIGPDGRGAFPLIGTFRLTGLTVDEADRALTAADGSV